MRYQKNITTPDGRVSHTVALSQTRARDEEWIAADLGRHDPFQAPVGRSYRDGELILKLPAGAMRAQLEHEWSMERARRSYEAEVAARGGNWLDPSF